VLKAGASGYMNKESAPEELMKAVRKLLGGGRYVSPALAETLASDLSQDTGRPPHEALSDREFEVLRKIASGKTVGQIAEELHLSVTTVSTYRARILEKMNMSTTAELMSRASLRTVVQWTTPSSAGQTGDARVTARDETSRARTARSRSPARRQSTRRIDA